MNVRLFQPPKMKKIKKSGITQIKIFEYNGKLKKDMDAGWK